MCWISLTNTATASIATTGKLVHISANTAQYYYATGNTNFSHGVLLQDATNNLTAATLQLKYHQQKHIIKEMIAYDKQKLVHYWTKASPNSKQISAYAKVMQFYPLASLLVLAEQVFITENHNKFTGKKVYYNIKKHTIKVPNERNQHNHPALLFSTNESLP
jgi:lipopolysaccharide transport protein LptA